MKQEVSFNSKGETCRGVLWLPDDSRGPFPTLIMAGGWCYVKEIVMPHYAERFVKEGIACLYFDYRYLGESSGTPRQHIDPWAQVEDYKNAIGFAEKHPDLDPARIGIWGISYSGGHVLIVGATDPRIRCIVSNIPVVDGYKTLLRDHGERRFSQLRAEILKDRRVRFENPNSVNYIPMSTPDPENVLSTWPFPHVHSIFTQIKETEAPRHEHRNTIESVEMLLNYTVFPYAERILSTPTLMVVAEDDNITSWDLEIAAFNSITSARKKLVTLPNVTHMSLYAQRSHLEIAAQEEAMWLRNNLVKSPDL